MQTTESSSPYVQICFPVQKGKPFPTLYWLSDAKLDKQLATLESKGAVKELRAWVAAEEPRVQAYQAMQMLYRDQRRSFIKLAEMAELPPGGRNRIWDTGIGGMEDWTLVRCLHLQYAFHLVHPNFVGDRIDQMLAGNLPNP